MSNQERFAFILLKDLLGNSAKQIAKELGCSEHEIETIISSPLYLGQKLEAIEAFRQNAVRSAADELELAAGDIVAFLCSVPGNVRFKDHLRIKAAMDILDRIPETSKTLRQHVRVDRGVLTDDQLDHLTKQLKHVDEFVFASSEEEEKEYRENLKQLLDVGKNANGS